MVKTEKPKKQTKTIQILVSPDEYTWLVGLVEEPRSRTHYWYGLLQRGHRLMKMEQECQADKVWTDEEGKTNALYGDLSVSEVGDGRICVGEAILSAEQFRRLRGCLALATFEQGGQAARLPNLCTLMGEAIEPSDPN